MTVLVTGATGMIGKATCSRFLRDGTKVRAAVRSRLSDLAGAESVRVGEIDGKTRWADALRGVDLVVHIAGLAHKTSGISDAELRRVNVDGTRNLASSALAAGVRRVVLLSTAKVHGEASQGGPFTEADAPNPGDAYSRSKYEAEVALDDVLRGSSTQFVICRPPLVYGPGVKANFYNLMKGIDRGLVLPFGSIRNSRSLVYADNLADALFMLGTIPEATGRAFLVSDGRDFSTRELSLQLARAMQKSARLIPVPPALLRIGATILGRPGVADRLLDSFQVHPGELRRLGWEPPYSPEQGFAATAAWFRGSNVDS